ncbi:hypothetical protein M441DRAFT_56571 [Trichoderma asperellum CBS 433.97]|uniref:Uncharacterized protein n=1 Tax=Trichoderma asperellum (strain ATCC 204424 / CBS 433.97 / NBRC 101777) TaxID=1042311 RepID=A0A2T3ZFK0_TRIA4|nr:hypothetical protein M441DRAFT_56571 [Trichoderma asperellum CBS 433.97]PTB43570.1 hypothetical protein M441DRAFT_56571 [Trichoderma asperellum CBS 433.97]
MSDEDSTRPGEDASSLKDYVVDAQEGISLPIEQHDDDEDISSEASTLLSSAGHHNHHPKHRREQHHQHVEGDESSSRTGYLTRNFGGEAILRMGLCAGMVVVVCLAVVRAVEGEFSPGLVAGGGLMMIMCLVVGKRDLWRGGMAIG